MTTDTEALVRRAYHLAEGDVLDVQGCGRLLGQLLPDVHREMHAVRKGRWP